MDTTGNNILITGGATGIGLAMAEAFIALGNNVIVCGRREEKLNTAKERLPGLHTQRCDISDEQDRERLYETAKSEKVNILINNAGIQRTVDLNEGGKALEGNDEISINLDAQIRMSALFIPLLKGRDSSAIINVSSGLAFVPMSRFPIYCATKAAMHSFTMSIRDQLRNTSINVFEVIPPTVHDTELKGKPLDKTDWSVSASEVASSVIDGIRSDTYEITVGAASGWSKASREELDEAFKRINSHS